VGRSGPPWGGGVFGRRVWLAGAAGLAVAGWHRAALAQAYPTRPVRIVSPFAPGGANDLPARVVAQHLTRALGQPFVVENRAGAAGNLGAEAVAKAAPDGYTLLMGPGALAINQTLYPRLPFDVLRDFAPISIVAMVPNVLAVHPAVPARTVGEFVAYAKANPRSISFGSPGSGSVGHLAGELFKMLTGAPMEHIPYRGSAPAVTDLLGGRIQAMLDNLPPIAQHLRSGALRGLGIASRERHPDSPEMPTIIEAGVPDFEVTAWQSLLAPARTPPEVVERLSAEVRRRIAEVGALPRGTTPA
jgi:tripartite-type tricarboxylate transporter receptor subunit TctC